MRQASRQYRRRRCANIRGSCYLPTGGERLSTQSPTWQMGVELPPPSADDLLHFLNGDPPYTHNTVMESRQYWGLYCSDSAIAPLGRVLASLPATTCAVERIFSSCGFQVGGREGLAHINLKVETYIRVNSRTLGWSS